MHARRGFTLVELLVVFAIIVLLVALLLPAVQSAREAARISQCKNNHKHVALSVLNYESANGTLPSIIHPTKTFSWRYSVLPFLEENSIYEQLQASVNYVNQNKLAVDPKKPAYVASYQCPSSPGVPILVRSYVLGHSNGKESVVFDALGRSHTWAPVRMNVSVPRWQGPCAWLSLASTAYVDRTREEWDDIRRTGSVLRRVTDGLSKTVLVFEQARRQHFAGPGKWGGDNFLTMFDERAANPTINASQSGFSSHHATKGAHAAMCDGSVRFLDESMSNNEVASLLIRNDE